MKQFSRIFEQRCIKWLAIVTGILAVIAGIFIITQPSFQTGGANDYPRIEFYDSWVLLFLLAKSALYCLLAFMLIVFFTNNKRTCLFIVPVFILIAGWNIFSSSLPTEVVFDKNTEAQRLLAYLDSENRFSSRFTGRQLEHNRIDNTTDSNSYECLMATTWWFGNFWIEERNNFPEIKIYNLNDQSIRHFDTEDSLFRQHCSLLKIIVNQSL